jgi:hypothetical protein
MAKIGGMGSPSMIERTIQRKVFLWAVGAVFASDVRFLLASSRSVYRHLRNTRGDRQTGKSLTFVVSIRTGHKENSCLAPSGHIKSQTIDFHQSLPQTGFKVCGKQQDF